MPPTPRSTTTEGLTDEKEAGTGGRAQGGNLCNVPSPKGGDHPTDRELVGAQREEPQTASSLLWILTSSTSAARDPLSDHFSRGPPPSPATT